MYLYFPRNRFTQSINLYSIKTEIVFVVFSIYFKRDYFIKKILH